MRQFAPTAQALQLARTQTCITTARRAVAIIQQTQPCGRVRFVQSGVMNADVLHRTLEVAMATAAGDRLTRRTRRQELSEVVAGHGRRTTSWPCRSRAERNEEVIQL